MSSFLYVENMNFITPAAVNQPLPGEKKSYYTWNSWWRHFECYFGLENCLIIKEFSKWNPC